MNQSSHFLWPCQPFCYSKSKSRIFQIMYHHLLSEGLVQTRATPDPELRLYSLKACSQMTGVYSGILYCVLQFKMGGTNKSVCRVVSAHENIQIAPGFAARSLASRRRFISFLGFTTKPKSEFAEPLSLELAAQSQSLEPELGA